MKDIFISYSTEDKARVMPLAKMLSNEGGWSIWWDQDIPSGKNYRKVIKKELSNAGCVLVVWSHTSIESDWVLDEADKAKKMEKLMPVFFDNVNIPGGFGQIHTANLINWDGSKNHTELEKLLKDIKSMLSHQQEPLRSISDIEVITPSSSNTINKNNTSSFIIRFYTIMKSSFLTFIFTIIILGIVLAVISSTLPFVV